jgi:carboxymethylenebutenolidase
MKESIETLATADGAMDLHCFVPESAPARRQAIIVLQEAFGVNPHMKRVCRRVASAGYAAFSPELFHRSGRGLEFGYDEFPRIKPMLGKLTNEQMLEDLRVTLGHVVKRPDVDPVRVASWGFCMGGFASVVAACELPVAAAISFYGGGIVNGRPGIGFTPLMDGLGSIRCPLLLVYGAKDRGITSADVEATRSRLTALGKAFDIEVYPNGGHGFFCEERAAYDHASAEASWERATTWLKSKLG